MHETVLPLGLDDRAIFVHSAANAMSLLGLSVAHALERVWAFGPGREFRLAIEDLLISRLVLLETGQRRILGLLPEFNVRGVGAEWLRDQCSLDLGGKVVAGEASVIALV